VDTYQLFAPLPTLPQLATSDIRHTNRHIKEQASISTN